MPRDSSGNYTLPAGNPVISGTVITSNWANDTMSDVGNEITNSLSRDGQGGMRAPLLFLDGSVLEPGITFVQEPSLGFLRASSQNMQAAVANRAVASFNLDTQLDVQRDYGGGLTWYPVMDIQGNDNAWDAKLDGYLATGLHEQYTGDLNDILANSNYSFDAGPSVTNEPADMTDGSGFITTSMWYGGNYGIQVIEGQNLTSTNKVWMRSLIVGAWQAWKLVVDGGALEFDASGNGIFSVGAFTTAAQPTANNAYTRKDYVDGTAFASGTVLPFYQTAAPTGWTKVTTVNDALLRVVSGSGGVQAGSQGFSTWNALTATGAHTLTAAQMPSHTHVYTEVIPFNSYAGSGVLYGLMQAATPTRQSNTSSAGSNGSHTHPLTNGVKYADFIIASKD